MPKDYSIKDMNWGLIGLNVAAQTAFHTMWAILEKEGVEAATEKFESIEHGWDINIILGMTAALTVAVYIIGSSINQSKTVFDRKIFSKARMEGALVAMVGYFGTTALNLYWVRLARLCADTAGGSYGNAIGWNFLLSTIIQNTLFYCFSRPFGKDASNATISGSFSISNALAMSAAMLPDFFNFKMPRFETIITQGAFGGLGAFLGSATFSSMLSGFDFCCGDGKKTKHVINDEERSLIVKLDKKDQESESKNCCVLS